MNSFRYDTSRRWYKGNVHVHSRASDGGKNFAELSRLYASAGYDFLFRTDHWVASDVSQDRETHPLLWLDGVEIDGQDDSGAYFHVVCLGRVKDIKPDEGLAAGLASARRQGALTILAHPHWCDNSLDDYKRIGSAGVEIYNHVCHWMNGKGDGLVYWSAALKSDPNALAFAVDDAHLTPAHPSWNGGWIMVNAQECSAGQILAAIRRGNFYSSCGPELHSITFDGHELHLVTSPVRYARLVGPGPLGAQVWACDGRLLRDARIAVHEDWPYLYAELEDANGRRAWTNPLFITETPPEDTDPGRA